MSDEQIDGQVQDTTYGDGYDASAQVVRDLALVTVDPVGVSTDEPQAHRVPAGSRLHITDPTAFDKVRATPRRMVGTVQPHTLASLIDYAKEHHSDAATVWLEQDSGKTVAVLNDHAGGATATDDQGEVIAARDGLPGWGDHRAIFTPAKTPEWIRWAQADGKWFDQEEFANFVEDGLGEIAVPNGGVLLDVVQTLTGHVNVTWENATRLSDGRLKVQYVEETSAKAGQKGDLEIPTEFTLVLPVFQGEEPVQLDAKLRWRLRNQKIAFAFKLDNPHRAVQKSIDLMLERLRGEFPRVYAGQPR